MDDSSAGHVPVVPPLVPAESETVAPLDGDTDDDEAAVTAEAAAHVSGGDNFSVSTAAV